VFKNNIYSNLIVAETEVEYNLIVQVKLKFTKELLNTTPKKKYSHYPDEYNLILENLHWSLSYLF